MKTILALLFITLSSSAEANNDLCADLRLSFNTHTHLSCPELKSMCLTTQSEGDMELLLSDGTVEHLPSHGEYVYHQSDIGSTMHQAFRLQGMPLTLNLNSDEDYPYPTREPGFSSLTISIGMREQNGVYLLQTCYYKPF